MNTKLLIGMAVLAALVAVPTASAHYDISYHPNQNCNPHDYFAVSGPGTGGTLYVVHFYSQTTVMGGCLIVGL